MADDSIELKNGELVGTATESLVFSGNSQEELMRFNLETGDIFHNGKLIETDKGLVKARCPKCGSLLEMTK